MAETKAASIHEYYHTEGMTDLSVLREDAQARLDGKGKHTNHAQESIIHLHPKRTIVIDGSSSDPVQEISCIGKDHEAYSYGPNGIYKYTLEKPMIDLPSDPPADAFQAANTDPKYRYVLVEIHRDRECITWRVDDKQSTQLGVENINVDELLSLLNVFDISCETVDVVVGLSQAGAEELHISMDIRQ